MHGGWLCRLVIFGRNVLYTFSFFLAVPYVVATTTVRAVDAFALFGLPSSLASCAKLCGEQFFC